MDHRDDLHETNELTKSSESKRIRSIGIDKVEDGSSLKRIKCNQNQNQSQVFYWIIEINFQVHQEARPRIVCLPLPFEQSVQFHTIR